MSKLSEKLEQMRDVNNPAESPQDDGVEDQDIPVVSGEIVKPEEGVKEQADLLEKYPVVKFNITESGIAEMKKYMDLTIKDIKDKKGYDIVHSARMHVKQTRCAINNRAKTLKREINAYKGRVNDMAKDIVKQLVPIEDYLLKEEKRIDEKKARIKAEKEKKLNKVADARVAEAKEYGAKLLHSIAKAMKEKDYAEYIDEVKKEAERKRKEKDEAERKAKELEEKEAKLKAEQEAFEKEKAEAEKKQAEKEKVEKSDAAVEESKNLEDPLIDEPKKVDPPDEGKEGDQCVACQGTGESSHGRLCHSCAGCGEKGTVHDRLPESLKDRGEKKEPEQVLLVGKVDGPVGYAFLDGNALIVVRHDFEDLQQSKAFTITLSEMMLGGVRSVLAGE